MSRTLINVPAKAKRGEVIEIKTLISHDMESGFRRGQRGKIVPRDIITCLSPPTMEWRFSVPNCIQRSPPIRFCRSPPSRPRAARIDFTWTGDNGFSATRNGSDKRRVSKLRRALTCIIRTLRPDNRIFRGAHPRCADFCLISPAGYGRDRQRNPCRRAQIGLRIHVG